MEAGAGMDQSIVKVSNELHLAYPALTSEFRRVVTEIRAGRPRAEALRQFAERTKVEDVRALVLTMIQTDKFGTSVGQALRTHAETARIKRRQRAEERAQKLGVKMVFPLVFCLFPAMYVIVLGPSVLRIIRVLGTTREVDAVGSRAGRKRSESRCFPIRSCKSCCGCWRRCCWSPIWQDGAPV